MFRKISVVLLFAVGAQAAIAQGEETLVPLKGNPVLQNRAKNAVPAPFVRKSGVTDTLQLPFFDDFSQGEVFPKTNLWVDRRAYINTDFAVNPPTIGVATLDALDSTGKPYFNINGGFGPCDTLTSQPIDLSTYNIGNNIYLSFYYQPQGWSFLPLAGQDSVILQFKRSNGSWHTVWSTPGLADIDFKPAIVQVTDPDDFHGVFQFRFVNYLTYLGGVGQWHIDYVYMERNRNGADTLFKDVAVQNKPHTFLKDYQEMPYHQFKGFENNEANTSTVGRLSNLDNTGRTVDIFTYTVRDNLGNVNTTQQVTGQALGPLADAPFTFSPLNHTAVPQTADTVYFDVTEKLQITGANFSIANDSFTRRLTFGNYLAYDDGTAESGYGIRNGSGKIAYRFRINKPDTLRAISVYYFQAEDTVKKPFNLAVWSSITPGAGTEQLVYTKAVTYPTYTDSINGYHTYVLDSALLVSNEFYIGWIQTSTFLLNVGWDRNYTFSNQPAANSALYFNTTGKWNPSFINGTLMMRPHLGKALPDTTLLSVEKPFKNQRNNGFTVYPNPANRQLNIVFPTEGEFTCTVTDITGKTVLKQVINSYDNTSLNVEHLTNGLYFITLHHPETGFYHSRFVRD